MSSAWRHVKRRQRHNVGVLAQGAFAEMAAQWRQEMTALNVASIAAFQPVPTLAARHAN
jgi:hypothetical protein